MNTLARETFSEEVIYRKNNKTIDKIHFFDTRTGAKIRTHHYDYFNDRKIRTIDEFDIDTGKKIRTTSFVLYKSVDEFDIDTGKKIRTINYDMHDENKVVSVQEYDLDYEKIVKISVFKKNSDDISLIKEINPKTEKVVKWTSYKDAANNVTSIHEYKPHKAVKSTYMHKENHRKINMKADYRDMNKLAETEKDRMAKLIDNLYKNNLKFELGRKTGVLF